MCSTAARMEVAAAVAGEQEEARFWRGLPATLAMLRSQVPSSALRTPAGNPLEGLESRLASHSSSRRHTRDDEPAGARFCLKFILLQTLLFQYVFFRVASHEVLRKVRLQWSLFFPTADCWLVSILVARPCDAGLLTTPLHAILSKQSSCDPSQSAHEYYHYSNPTSGESEWTPHSSANQLRARRLLQALSRIHMTALAIISCTKYKLDIALRMAGPMQQRRLCWRKRDRGRADRRGGWRAGT